MTLTLTSVDEEVRLQAVQTVVPEVECRQPGPIDGRRYAREVHVDAVHLAQTVVRLGARAQGVERTRLAVLQKDLGFRAGDPQHQQQRERHQRVPDVYERHGRLAFETQLYTTYA